MMEKSAVYAAQGRASASAAAERAQAAGVRMTAETNYYNEQMAGGKWRNIMAMEMQKGEWPSMRTTPPVTPEALSRLNLANEARLGVAFEGRLETDGRG